MSYLTPAQRNCNYTHCSGYDSNTNIPEKSLFILSADIHELMPIASSGGAIFEARNDENPNDPLNVDCEPEVVPCVHGLDSGFKFYRTYRRTQNGTPHRLYISRFPPNQAIHPVTPPSTHRSRDVYYSLNHYDDTDGKHVHFLCEFCFCQAQTNKIFFMHVLKDYAEKFYWTYPMSFERDILSLINELEFANENAQGTLIDFISQTADDALGDDIPRISESEFEHLRTTLTYDFTADVSDNDETEDNGDEADSEIVGEVANDNVGFEGESDSDRDSENDRDSDSDSDGDDTRNYSDVLNPIYQPLAAEITIEGINGNTDSVNIANINWSPDTPESARNIIRAMLQNNLNSIMNTEAIEEQVNAIGRMTEMPRSDQSQSPMQMVLPEDNSSTEPSDNED